MQRGKYLSVPLFIVAMLFGEDARSTDIYRWVDDEGVVHYSDTRPSNDQQISTLRVNDANTPDYNPTDDPYSIVNQAKRTNDKWSEIEEERDKRAKERREQQARYVPFQPTRYAGWRYNDWPAPYQPPYSVRSPSKQLPVIRRQTNLLETLNLSGPRPYSINSGAHHARVKRSNNFLSTRTTPR